MTGIGGGAIAYMTSEQLSCGLSSPPIGFPVNSEQWQVPNPLSLARVEWPF